ncbi:MAG: universal stress protein [Anaerolineales bacterium]|nr:universal stress protein [Anaerolineales bacterium]
MTKHYQHILVPLDGSALAELALADAFAVAELSRAELTLLQVVPPIDHVIATEAEYPIFIDQQWEAKKEEAREYLLGVCERAGCPDIPVHTVVEMGSAAETIIDYAHHHPIDLVVMATHGRSGLQRWVYGSVADKVLRGATQPILLVRAYPGNPAKG